MPEDLAERRAGALRAGSRTLAELLDQDPLASGLLGQDDPLPSDYSPHISVAFEAEGPDGLRRERRRRLLEIAARDLAGECSLEIVGERLSALADACLRVALDSLDPPEGFVVISMGKLGGRELNYSSDIDLMFVAEGDVGRAQRCASSLVSLLGDFSPVGQAYRIDLNLRPEGRSGSLTRSLEGYLEYYRRWAQVWEHQALIKARASAGDLNLGATFVERTRSFVYATEVTEERVAEIRRMKTRVESHAQHTARRARTTEQADVKLGPGGIRDIEFSIQLLQLVHGGTDPEVRSGTTLDALNRLVQGGYVAEEDGAGLGVAYRWHRNVEHRLQLWQERQTHHLPSDEVALARVARTLGFRDSPAMGAAARFEEAHRSILADVRGRFEKLFYRPMIQALAEGGASGLSEDALKERLHVLGFRDVRRAARVLEGLVSGGSRRAKLLRVLTPAMLRFLSSSPQPDAGLFGFLRLSEALQDRLDVLGSMRDNPPGIALLARVLGSGRFLGEVLAQVPEEIGTIADPQRSAGLKPRDQLVREAHSSLSWRGPERLLEGLRRFKRREMLRIALSDLAGEADGPAVGGGLSALAEACLEAAVADATIPFAVIGMGKLGGRELSYSSDLDVMFVFDGSAAEGERIAAELVRAISEVTPEGQAFRIDAGLRPEGKSGVLARSVESYAEYYSRWSQPWEHLASIKARAVAGDMTVANRLIDLTRELAFPVSVPASALAEIRHLKVRMEKERIPRAVDARRHSKLGPGGMTDIEFAAQLIQFQHGHRAPSLRVEGTLDALEAAASEGFLEPQDLDRLQDAYRFLMELRNRLFFLYGRPTDVLPVKPEEMEALGIAMGYSEQPRQELDDAYLRHTRRARKVAERIIFGAPA